eukprot:TRINITY_DN14274_c0_g1_i2.p1 TRINITY_DN14274_c0_g1~~TRINITY_DN14274_c0_g1_i2.p1  ORF type:complete len:142 (+),score=20.35 TRINITY_DN14274_c0_g1_i2:83-508(+)
MKGLFFHLAVSAAAILTEDQCMSEQNVQEEDHASLLQQHSLSSAVNLPSVCCDERWEGYTTPAPGGAWPDPAWKCKAVGEGSCNYDDPNNGCHNPSVGTATFCNAGWYCVQSTNWPFIENYCAELMPDGTMKTCDLGESSC